MSAFDSAEELGAFFSTDEFAENATLTTGAGEFALTGIPDVLSDVAKPGGIQNSSRSPFLTGAAEFSIQEFQFLTSSASVRSASAKMEDKLTILTGSYAGVYRVKDINHDGAICRLLLNKSR